MKVPVKKVNLYILDNQFEQLVKLLQKNKFLMVEASENSLKTDDVGNLDELLVRVNKAIKYLEGFREKRKFFEYKEATYEELDDRSGEYLNLLKSIEELEQKANKHETKIEKLTENYKHYEPFITNELNLEDMSHTKYIDFFHGFIDSKKQEELKEFFVENKLSHAFFETDKRGYAVTFASLKANSTTFLQEAKRLDFKEVNVPSYDGNIKEYLEDLKIEKTQYEILLNETNETLSSYLPRLNELYVYADQIASDKIRLQVPYEVHSEKLNILKLTGWIKEKREEEIKEILTLNNLSYELESAIVEEGEVIPTALENNKFVEPFEFITEQFSAPTIDDIDPNPAMSFWYWIIFGIMMGDIGYGLILVIGLGLVLKFMKPKGGTRQLLTILYYSGYTTILFGILHGSLFGVDFDLGAVIGSLFGQNWTFVLFNPIQEALTMLIYALVLGFFHINHGLILKAKNLFMQGNWQGALGEAIGSILILVGLGLLVLSMVSLPFNLPSTVGVVVIILGALLIIGFAGNDKGVLGMISGKLGGLYGTISQLSDILSYSRLLALALSTAVIAYTFNTLGLMMMGSVIGFIFALIIYFIGHGFGFAMGLLSAYIHDSRLQYVEFYGKFFEGGGRYFKPLTLELNHLNEVKNNIDFGGK